VKYEAEVRKILESEKEVVRRRGEIPVFITDTVCDDYVGQLSHDGLGSCVHEIECSAIIWLFEGVFV